MARYRIIIVFILIAILLSSCRSGPGPSLLSAAYASATPGSPVDLDSAVALPAESPTPFPTKESAAPTPSAPAVPAPSDTPAPLPTPSLPPTPAAASSLLGADGFPENINPLTGLPAPDPTLLNRRPAMVKVSNYPRTGRPHAGLSFADMVFEYYIGEEANRFLGIYYSQDSPKTGPERSGRLMDAWLTRMYQGVLAYGNADPRVDEVLVRELGERAISFNDSSCPAVCGQDTHSVTGVFVNTGELTRFADQLGVENRRYDLSGMLFDPTVPQSDQLAVNVGVEYSIRDRGEWHYNPETQLYDRWIESYTDGNNYPMIPLVDRDNQKLITAANVIIIYATYIRYNETLLDIEIWDNTDGQRAIFFRDGVMIDGSWRAPGHDRPIQFYNQYGLPMPLKPGNTWIVIAGMASTFEPSQPGAWELHFDLP